MSKICLEPVNRLSDLEIGPFCTPTRRLFVHHLDDLVAFAWRQKKVGFEAVLTHVEIVVAILAPIQGLMCTPFDDPSPLYHKDLVCAADGGKTVGDDKRRATLHEVAEAVLDHGLGFGVQ